MVKTNKEIRMKRNLERLLKIIETGRKYQDEIKNSKAEEKLTVCHNTNDTNLKVYFILR